MIERQENERKRVEILDIEALVPKFHLLRKIERSMDWEKVYGLVEHLYSKDRGRPSIDPVVLIKIVLLQHLYGIWSLRQTVVACEENITYR